MRNAVIILIALLVLLLLISAFGGSLRWPNLGHAGARDHASRYSTTEYMTAAEPINLGPAHAMHEGYEHSAHGADGAQPEPQPEPQLEQQYAEPQAPSNMGAEGGDVPVEPFNQGGEFAVFSAPESS